MISVHGGVFFSGFVTEPRRACGICLRVVRCVVPPAAVARLPVRLPEIVSVWPSRKVPFRALFVAPC